MIRLQERMLRYAILAVLPFLDACGSAHTVAAITGQLASSNAAMVATVTVVADTGVVLGTCGSSELCARSFEDEDNLAVYARWNTGADLDLVVALPNGELAQEMDAHTRVARSRGDCGVDSLREEVFAVAHDTMAQGPYVLQMRHTATCGAAEPASVEVLVRFRGNTLGYYTFSLPAGQEQSIAVLTAE